MRAAKASVEESEAGRQRTGPVEHDPRGLPAFYVAHRQRGVVGAGRAAPDEDGIELRPPPVDQPPRRRARDPARVAGFCCHLPVERLRYFKRDERTSGLDVVDKRFVEPAARLFQHANPDVDAALAQPCDAATGHLGKRIHRADDHAWDAFFENEVGAGGRLPIMAARLQVDVERRGAECRGGLGSQATLDVGDGLGLSVGCAVACVPPLPQHLSPLPDDYGTHHRIGADVAGSTLGQFQAAPYPDLVHAHAYTSSIYAGRPASPSCHCSK